MTTVQVSEAGAIPLPPELHQASGIQERSYVVIEQVAGGILIRPVPGDAETYTPERKAEFLLTAAVDEADYQRARQEVQAMGLDPDNIPHQRPAAV